MSLLEKLKKNSRIKETDVLSESKVYKKSALVPTRCPMINVALSGSLDGGISPGLLALAGESRMFKSGYALLLASAYMKKYPEAILLFYDSEFGTPQDYFGAHDIDMNRVLHTPVKDIEELKFDLVHQLDTLEKTDKVFVIIDSVGNLASKKELQDALDEKSVADMSRAKALKGLFRMVTPYFTLKDIPCVAIFHVYKEIGLFPKTIMAGGSGGLYSSNAVWIVSRSQDKVGTEVQGYNFTINIEKSRYVKEKSKIPINITFSGGIKKYSGILEQAEEGGFIQRSSAQFVTLIDTETGEMGTVKFRPKQVPEQYFAQLVEYEPFKKFIREKYTIGLRSMISDDSETSGDTEFTDEDE